MSGEEKKMHDALIALTKKFRAVWSNVYFLSMAKTFCINIPGFSQDEVAHLTEFCHEHNLRWVVMQEYSNERRGVSISFHKN